MFAKLATAVPAGAAMTLSLLFAMQALITMQSGEVIEQTPSPRINFIREIPDEQVFPEEFRKPEPIEQIDHPEMPLTNDKPDWGTLVPFSHTPPAPKNRGGEFTNPFMSDGPLTKIVIVQPSYPIAAAERSIEGYVIVEFDVLENGTVGNVMVIESSNSIFNRSAMQAANRFRYKARIVDGVPQATSGVQYKFSFEMDD